MNKIKQAEKVEGSWFKRTFLADTKEAKMGTHGSVAVIGIVFLCWSAEVSDHPLLTLGVLLTAVGLTNLWHLIERHGR